MIDGNHANSIDSVLNLKMCNQNGDLIFGSTLYVRSVLFRQLSIYYQAREFEFAQHCNEIWRTSRISVSYYRNFHLVLHLESSNVVYSFDSFTIYFNSV